MSPSWGRASVRSPPPFPPTLYLPLWYELLWLPRSKCSATALHWQCSSSMHCKTSEVHMLQAHCCIAVQVQCTLHCREKCYTSNGVQYQGWIIEVHRSVRCTGNALHFDLSTLNQRIGFTTAWAQPLVTVSDCVGIWSPFVLFPGLKSKTNSSFFNTNTGSQVWWGEQTHWKFIRLCKLKGEYAMRSPIFYKKKHNDKFRILKASAMKNAILVFAFQTSQHLKTIATIVTEHTQLSDSSSLYSLSEMLSLGVFYERSIFSIELVFNPHI